MTRRNDRYRLLGMMMGIALYNNVNLDLNFPRVVYEKLMDGKQSRKQPMKQRPLHEKLELLSDIDPALAHGLRETLNYDGDDFEDVFENTFSVEYEVFGEKRIDALCKDGAEKVLTTENREEFVELYIDYKLNKSVKQVFDAFRNGFWKVVDNTSALKLLFEPTELEYLICGTQDLDFVALERITKYDGFEGGKEHQVVKWFWEVVETFTDVEKVRSVFLLNFFIFFFPFPSGH